jgi:hypothetical protein
MVVFIATRDRQRELGEAFKAPGSTLSTTSPEAIEVYDNVLLLPVLKSMFGQRIQVYLNNFIDDFELRKGWEVVKIKKIPFVVATNNSSLLPN